MGQLSVDVNNNGILTLTQGRHDGDITLGSNDNEYIISAGELVMLMNYFRNCKSGREESDYISKHGEIYKDDKKEKLYDMVNQIRKSYGITDDASYESFRDDNQENGRFERFKDEMCAAAINALIE